jgi:hypothetical protein
MTFPKKYKIINGKLHKLRFRFETKKKAEDSSRYQRRFHSTRMGYSLIVVKLPKDQWGMVEWDRKPWATYEYLGFVPHDPYVGQGLSALFDY